MQRTIPRLLYQTKRKNLLVYKGLAIDYTAIVSSKMQEQMTKYTTLSANGSKNVCNRYTLILSYDVSSGNEITSCSKIDKPLVDYRFSGNVMTSVTTLHT